MRRIALSILFLCSCIVTSAQESDENLFVERYHYETFEQEIIQSDTLLFYRILHQPSDLYGELSAYNFSFTASSRRGEPYYNHPTLLNGITVRSANTTILRNMDIDEQSLGHPHRGYAAGATHFSTTHYTPLTAYRASLFFSGKGYLGGVRATMHHFMQRGWTLSAHLSARGGDGLYVDGVWQNRLDVGLRVGREFSSGSTLSIVLTAPISYRGLRSGTTREAFRLAGDNLYNPSWGYQQGRKRNARNRREFVPLLVATYRTEITPRTSLILSTGGEWGKIGTTTLGWYGTSTPMPDNYRYLPSYYTEPTVAQAVEQAWMSDDSRYTQIDWAELYTVNAISDGEARYALERRVNRLARAEVAAMFHSAIGRNLNLEYGLRATASSSRNYKQMDDLLGAEYLTDIDYYLLDDDSYSLNLQNDLRHPNRKVHKGNRFGYDYTLAERELSLVAEIAYQSEQWMVEAHAEAGSHTISRKGHFEKEIFPDALSYGKSRRITLSPYTLGVNVGYTFSPQHHLSAAAMLSHNAPYASSLFLNPQYNNRTIDTPTTERHIALDATYKYRSSKADITASLFLHSRGSGIESLRAYDDLSATFSDIIIDNISTLGYGIELSSQIRLSRKWRTSLCLGAGNYTYTSNPTVSIYSDTDNSLISRSRSLMQGIHCGGTPHINGSAMVTYLDYTGWALSLGVNVAAIRYADPAFTRRTERVAMQSAPSEEVYREFLAQSSLGDAATLDASVSRWFNIGEGRLSLTLSVRNLLGKRNIVYSGYESSRIRHYRSGAQHIYRPQDDILTYAYPRNIHFVASWRF